MDRLVLYRIFNCVVETRSFTKAANALHMPRSTVSTAIAELEARLGVRLLNRTTRVVAPTLQGEEFYERCLSFLGESDEIEAMFRTGTSRIEGQIRIDLPGRIGRLIVAPALPEFLATWPGMRIDIGMTDRAVDLLGEQVDLALRVGPLADSGLRARKLGMISQINVASPAYLARHGQPRSPADLDAHWQVAYSSPSTARIADWEWTEAERLRLRPVPWRVAANSAEGYIACALAGMGMIQIPAYDVDQHLHSGELVEIMPDHRPGPMPMHLIFPNGPRNTNRLKVFVDWLENLLRQKIRP